LLNNNNKKDTAKKGSGLIQSVSVHLSWRVGKSQLRLSTVINTLLSRVCRRFAGSGDQSFLLVVVLLLLLPLLLLLLLLLLFLLLLLLLLLLW